MHIIIYTTVIFKKDHTFPRLGMVYPIGLHEYHGGQGVLKVSLSHTYIQNMETM